MGAILAVQGSAGDPALPELLQRMIDTSPYNGKVERLDTDGLSVAVQSLGWDASVDRAAGRVVAVHGYLSRWEEQARARGLEADPGWSDARKLAHAHRLLGDDLFPLLHGEFALLIHHPEERRLMMLRDIVGCRPLFFEQRDGRGFFATEVRQVLSASGSSPEPCRDLVMDYLLNRPLAREETLHLPVRRILPGRIYTFDTADPAAGPGRTTYWSPPEPRRGRIHQEELAAELLALIGSALDAALPDGPCGLALSGGVDSTTLWAVLARETAAGNSRAGNCIPYSLVYPGLECDEEDLVRQVLAHCGSPAGRLIDASGFHPFEAYPEVIERTGSLFPPTLFQLGPLMEAAREDGRRIVFTGLGPDDWLRGHPGWIPDQLFRGAVWTAVRDAFSFQTAPGQSRLRFVKHLMGLAATRVFPGLLAATRPDWLSPTAWHRSGAGSSRSPWDRFSVPLARRVLFRYLERYRSGLFLEPMAQYAASAGVELRHPILGREFVEFAFRTPARAFTGGRRYKDLLRLAAGDLLPSAVRDRVRRTVFNCLFQQGGDQLRVDRGYGTLTSDYGILSGTALPEELQDVTDTGSTGTPSLQAVCVHIAALFLEKKLKV